MKKIILQIFAVLLFLIPTTAIALTNEEIKDRIIEKSIAEYKKTKGNCPCPYNRDARGYKCGKRSAYSKPGGESPICYPEDVTEEMIRRFKNQKL